MYYIMNTCNLQVNKNKKINKLIHTHIYTYVSSEFLVGEANKGTLEPHLQWRQRTSPKHAIRQWQSQDLEVSPPSKTSLPPSALTFPLSVAHGK